MFFFMALMSLRVEFNCEENQKTQKLYTYTYSNINVIIYDYDNIEKKKEKNHTKPTYCYCMRENDIQSRVKNLDFKELFTKNT